MSDSSTKGVDPRFDPRFQRGYTGADEANTPVGPPSPYPPRVPGAEQTRPAAGDATARLLEAMQRTAPPRPIVPPASAAPPGADDDTSATALADLRRLAPEPQPQPEPASGSGDQHARPWFIAGWVLSAALLAIGTWWAWAANSDPTYYMGVGGIDMAFRQLGWSLGAPLLQAGALGVVLVTSFAAARQLDQSGALRRTAGDNPIARGPEFWRTPGVVALVAIVAVLAVVVIWLVRQVTEGSVFGFGPEPSDEEITRMALSQFASTAIGPLAFAAFGAVFGIILLGARHARHLANAGDAGDVSEPRAR
ncbi:hypothetical protein [Agromyces ramosus]|uniref:Uncharacterized protein n=1 Tax=Agromyces ramosus TaxID=33879 RepID=A0ABU0R8K4_9MICO|nr:hypothetical protein [Agromyces ramosus]MDQ0894403.1 hypothetical protein [Agromyces ramosus]